MEKLHEERQERQEKLPLLTLRITGGIVQRDSEQLICLGHRKKAMVSKSNKNIKELALEACQIRGSYQNCRLEGLPNATVIFPLHMIRASYSSRQPTKVTGEKHTVTLRAHTTLAPAALPSGPCVECLGPPGTCPLWLRLLPGHFLCDVP